MPGAQLVQYVKICSLYGAGFYYIPGTDTCLKVGGKVRAEMNFNAGNSFVQVTGDHSARSFNFENSRSRGLITLDARSQTEYGTLRAYLQVGSDWANGTGGWGWAARAFIQWAGFTFGHANSAFGFFSFGAYSNQTNWLTGDVGGGGIDVLSYTAQFGNGMSATLSLEDTTTRRVAIYTQGYAGRQWPDVVGNLRIDQAWGGAQIMGAVHQVRGATYGDKVGWAVGGGLKVNLPWGKGDNVSFQAAYAKGAIDYVAANVGTFTVTNNGTNIAYGNTYDAVGTGTALELTSAWSVGAGAVHHWNSMWQTSIYGGYGAVDYGSAATAVLNGTSGNPDWNFAQVGSRTVWTPVKNLALSVDVIYNHVGTATAQTGTDHLTASSVGWVAGIFRAERAFWP